LGQKTFGNVYQGEHLYLKALAAVKLLHGQIEAYEMDGFLQEAQMIAALKDESKDLAIAIPEHWHIKYP
jgi:hypothetical protein